ncbi:hypothetical protein Ahy_B03g064173 [Arachis hypogaea]|uniref:SWIM-type domain-containing protein n=1 Tax=Arachis hypogaea TaxID=3818 RepID=A0A444ZYZ8_ARAHY|nr:hypothetical protein Ahy_B03g064173 [Arachis hypogaea]
MRLTCRSFVAGLVSCLALEVAELLAKGVCTHKLVLDLLRWASGTNKNWVFKEDVRGIQPLKVLPWRRFTTGNPLRSKLRSRVLSVLNDPNRPASVVGPFGSCCCSSSSLIAYLSSDKESKYRGNAQTQGVIHGSYILSQDWIRLHMDSSFQFSGGEDDSDRLTEEKYFGISSSSGNDDDDSFGDDSETACKQFSQLRGFGVRKGDVAQINGILVRRDFFYHRQSTRHEKHYDYPERVHDERFESRMDCTAKLKIYYDLQDQVWKVKRIEDNHNHPLAATMFSHLLPSHRNLSESDKAQVDSLKKFRIATSNIMAYMVGQSGGYGILWFTTRDLYNYVNADMMLVAKYTKTADDRLGSLLWADGQMMADYQLFGDVLAFDATYWSNKYKKPLIVFSESNHHKQTTIFGFALLEDEEVRTYRWVLCNILDVMDNKTPYVVVIDGDKAMRAAIAEVFKKAVYANFDITEFEEYWKTAVESLGLMNNSWVKRTYELRQSWATTYLRETFCAGYSLLELVHSLDRVVKDYRNNKVTAQFYLSYYTPMLTTSLNKIELFALKIYTRAIFKEVRKQIKKVGSLLFLGKDSISTISVYKFSNMGNHHRVCKVLYDPNEPKIECDCQIWNSEGIPCCHIICMMKYESLDKIPPGLILRRWCKNAKEWTAIATQGTEGHGTRLLWYGALCNVMNIVAKLVSDDTADFAMARDAIPSLAQRLHGRRGNTIDREAGLRQQNVVKDPSVTRTKGAPKHGRNLASSTQDEPVGKRRCCTSCGLPGHTKRMCRSQRETSQVGLREGISATVRNSSSREPSWNPELPTSSEIYFMLSEIF